MKIGILTFHAPSNFGANLQAYASSNYFRSLGHDAKIINYIRDADIQYKKRVNIDQYNEHIKFRTTILNVTREVNSIEGLKQVVIEEKFDLIVVGADAVWRSKEGYYVYFLDWLFKDLRIKDIPAVSMSAAHMGMGFSNLSDEGKHIIKESLSNFKYISVRDIWTKYVLCRDILDTSYESKIKINPDPVFLLSDMLTEKWDDKGFDSKKYYLLTLPKDWMKSCRSFQRKRRIQWFNNLKDIVNRNGYKLIELPLPEGPSGMNFDYTLSYPIAPLQWFLWIKNAKAFCGLRFHAIVSSISSGTPFYSIDSYGSSSKLSILLVELGLYKVARLLDKKSKIRNLLKNTKFETHRVPRNIEVVNPAKLFEKLENSKVSDINKIKEDNVSLFIKNMDEMFNNISK